MTGKPIALSIYRMEYRDSASPRQALFFTGGSELRLVLQRKLQQLVVAFDVELLTDMHPVVFHCPHAHEEPFGDLLACEIAGEQREDGMFGGRKPVERGNGCRERLGLPVSSRSADGR